MINNFLNIDEAFFRESINNFNGIIKNLFNSVNSQAISNSGGFQNLIYQDSSIYEKIVNISNNVILPIAILLLLTFLVIDLSVRLSEVSTMNSDTSISYIISFVFKLLIGVILISNAPKIVEITFDTANYLTQNAHKYIFDEEENRVEDFDLYDLMEQNLKNRGIEISTEITFTDLLNMNGKDVWEVIKTRRENSRNDIEDGSDFQTEEKEDYYRDQKILETYLDNTEVNGLFITFVISLIVLILSYLFPLAVGLVMLRRGLELYLYLAVSPITLGFLFNRHTQQSGVNFLKNIFAYGLQLLVIFFVVYIYSSLTNLYAVNLLKQTGEIKLTTLAMQYGVYTIFGIGAVMGSKSLTQRALGSF